MQPDRPLPLRDLSLRDALIATCAQLLPRCGDTTADGVQQVIARLEAPLQVVVAGRISSGKSTLVNALIGRRVAPTAVGECTHLVTRFSYGTVDRVEWCCATITDCRCPSTPTE